MYKKIKAYQPEAYLSSICQLHPVNDNILAPTGGAWDYKLNTGSGGGETVKRAVVEHLMNADPDVVFVHFDDIDAAGHRYGFETYTDHHPEYINAIEETDGNIGDILDALKNRSKEEEWMVIGKIFKYHERKENSFIIYS